MNELLLVVTIAGERVALPAAAVEVGGRARHADPGAARRAACRRPVGAAQPRADRDRLHALARARRRPIAPTAIREAAVVELDGHHYALIVDLVEDVVEALSDPAPVRAAMGAGWERVSQGMVETEEGPLLLVDVAALIAGAEAEARAA